MWEPDIVPGMGSHPFSLSLCRDTFSFRGRLLCICMFMIVCYPMRRTKPRDLEVLGCASFARFIKSVWKSKLSLQSVTVPVRSTGVEYIYTQSRPQYNSNACILCGSVHKFAPTGSFSWKMFNPNLNLTLPDYQYKYMSHQRVSFIVHNYSYKYLWRF